MSSSTQPDFKSPRQMALLVLSGVFASLPLWDVVALTRAVRSEGGSELWQRLSRVLGALLLALLGLWGLGQFLGDDISADISLWTGVPLTLALYVITMLCAGLLSGTLFGGVLLVRGALKGRGRLAGVVETLLRMGFAGLGSPVGPLLIVTLVVFGARLDWISISYENGRAAMLLVAGIASGLLPGLLVGRAGLKAWDLMPNGAEQLLPAALAMGRAGLQMAGWVLGSAVIVETIAGIPGVGSGVIAGLASGEGGRLARALLPLTLGLGVIRLRLAILESAVDALLPAKNVKREGLNMEKSVNKWRWLYFAGAGLLLLLAVAWILRNGMGPRALMPDPAGLYAPASMGHPLGTDALGRDVQRRLWQTFGGMWLGALAGAVVAVGLGGMWGLVLATVKDRGSWLALLLRWPAEALTLFSPALVLALLILVRFGGGLSGVETGIVVGLALIPRMVWDGAQWADPILDSQQWQERLRGIVLVPGWTALVVLHISVNVSVLGIGQTPGVLLAPVGDLLAGAWLADGGTYLWLALNAGIPVLLVGWALAMGVHGLELIDDRRQWLSGLLA